MSCFYRLLLEELADFPERSERSGLELSDLLDAGLLAGLSDLVSDFSEVFSFFESEPDLESAPDFESESFFELESPLEEDPAEPDFLA